MNLVTEIVQVTTKQKNSTTKCDDEKTRKESEIFFETIVETLVATNLKEFVEGKVLMLEQSHK